MSIVNPSDRIFFGAFLSLGLTQWVNESTYPRSGNILDLILTTEQDRVCDVEVLPPLPGCDHCLTVCGYLFDLQPFGCPSARMVRKWHKGKYKAISRMLDDVDWDIELVHLDAGQAYSRFLDILSPLVDKYVPLADISVSNSRLPWKSSPPSRMRTKRKEAWKKYKALRSSLGRHSHVTKQALVEFFSANREFRVFSTSSQITYELGLANELKSNPKQFHAYLRRKKVGCPSVGPIRLPDGALTDEPMVMADSFAVAFESVYSRDSPQAVVAPHQVTESRMPPITLHIQTVLDILLALDVNSAAGADELHPMLLKTCAQQLAYPLYNIFRLSLSESSLPREWKLSVVVPIFKKGSRHNPLNYRPISLTSVPCKCLERIIANQLYNYLEVNSLLSPHQFGFRPGRSTMDQLLLVYDSISKWRDEGSVTDLILFDFSKAFDVVSHPILLAKLSHLGIDDNLVSWLSHFLVGRTMSVSVKGQRSTPRQVTSGVPQGSVLGPILFLIFVNHIAENLTCQYKIFADDLKLYMRIRHDCVAHHQDDLRLCQEDINTLCHTASSWNLKLNRDKCAVIRFQRKGLDIPPPVYHIEQSVMKVVASHPDIGVLID